MATEASILAADYHRLGFEAYLMQQRGRESALIERTEPGDVRAGREYTHYSTEVLWKAWKRAIDVERGSRQRNVVGQAT